MSATEEGGVKKSECDEGGIKKKLNVKKVKGKGKREGNFFNLFYFIFCIYSCYFFTFLLLLIIFFY